MILVRMRGGMGAVENSLWPSTGAIDTETNSLDLQVKQLAQDVFNATTPDSDAYFVWQNSWNTFVADFDQWRDAGWFWNLTRRDELLEYRTRFNDLLSQAKALGVSTAVQPQADAPSSSFDKLLGTVTTIAIVAGIGVGGYYAVKTWRALRTKGT